MKELLGIPDEMIHPENRCKWDGLEGLCVALNRSAYPCRYEDLVPTFGLHPSMLSIIYNDTMIYIYERWSHLLDTFQKVCMAFQKGNSSTFLCHVQYFAFTLFLSYLEYNKNDPMHIYCTMFEALVYLDEYNAYRSLCNLCANLECLHTSLPSVQLHSLHRNLCGWISFIKSKKFYA